MDISRARKALIDLWPFLEKESDLPEQVQKGATELQDLMGKETFFREFPSIDQLTRTLEAEYKRRYEEAMQATITVYTQAVKELKMTPGWGQIDTEQQDRISEPMESLASYRADESSPIPQIRADHDACQGRLTKAVEGILKLIDGNRIISVSASSYFSGGVETEEQLDQALSGLKTECLELIGAGKKVLIQ